MARSMLAVGMLAALALSMAKRSAKLVVGSVPLRAAIAIALPSLVNTAPRAASLAPFSLLIVDHLECPDMFRSLILLCYFTISGCLFPEDKAHERDGRV